MEILRFLIILQKIVFALILLTFIPIAIMVSSPTSHSISNAAETAYQNFCSQVKLGFILNQSNGTNCSNQLLTIANGYCLQYCIINQTCQIIPSSSACTVGIEQYVLSGSKYCSNTNILNIISFANTSGYSVMSRSNIVPPLFQINSQASSGFNYYIYNGQSAGCVDAIKFIGNSIQYYDEQLYLQYSISLWNQFYPLIAIYVLVFIGLFIDIVSQYNLRQYVIVGMLMICILQLGLAFVGIGYKTQSDQIQGTLSSLASNCLISSTYASSTNAYFQIGSSNGLSISFIYFIGFICFLLCLCILALILIAFFQYRTGKAKHQASSGYELQTY